MAKMIKKETVNYLWCDDPELTSTKNDPPQDLDWNQIELHMRAEKKGRGGKPVMVIYNFPKNHPDFKKLTKKLKRECGSGGTFKGESIEIQGDHRDKINTYLLGLGFKVKMTGG